MSHFLMLITVLFFNVNQPNSVEGVWITQDDETGQKKSEVLIYQENGKLYGKILKLLLPEDEGKLCTECNGENKNKPIEGIVIVNDLILNDGT